MMCECDAHLVIIYRNVECKCFYLQKNNCIIITYPGYDDEDEDWVHNSCQD